MKKNSNIYNRMDWLKAMLTDEIATIDVDADKLKNAKSFCTLEIPQLFGAISYNTLKSYLQKTENDEFGVHAFSDNFEFFLELRKQVYDDLVEISRSNEVEKRDDVDWKRMYRNALWQSNLCSTAYLSLRREIQALLQAGESDQRLDYRRLEKALKRSAATYLKIISQEPEPVNPELKIVAGDKK